MSSLRKENEEVKQEAEQVQNLEIQVGEPFNSQIDYSLSDQELLEYVDQQMLLISQGQKELANIELMMLAYAFDFIDFAQRAAKTELKLTEEDIPKFDGLLQAVHNMAAEGRLPQEALNDIARNAAGYLGVVLLKNKKGNWVQSNLGMAINFNGTNAFLYNRIGRRIVNGPEDDIMSFYRTIIEEV